MDRVISRTKALWNRSSRPQTRTRAKVQPPNATLSKLLDQVFNVAELLEQILLWLTLDEVLRVRQVSKSWQAIIMRTKYIRDIQAAPHVSVCLNLPKRCSLRSGKAPVLTADLTLQYDKPLTVVHNPLDRLPRCISCLQRPDWIFQKK